MTARSALEEVARTYWRASRRVRFGIGDDASRERDRRTLDLIVRAPGLPRPLHVGAVDALGEAVEAEAARGRP
jgi:hypothetical protein